MELRRKQNEITNYPTKLSLKKKDHKDLELPPLLFKKGVTMAF
jgi:hypothetical protein